MIVSVCRATVPLAALALVTAVVTGCGGPGGDTARATASPAVSPSATVSSAGPASHSPSAGTGHGAGGKFTGYVTLPASASGRTPVFQHGPRARGGKNGDGGGGGGQDKLVALTFNTVMSPEDEKGAAAGKAGEKKAEGAGNTADGARHDNPALIAALRREKVPATVFMTGVWARSYPHQARAIGSDPLFEVAGHSYSHHAFAPDCRDLPELASDKQLADVRKGLAAIRAAGVENPAPYFRFPGGCHDDRSRRALAPSGVTAVAGDVLGGDAGASDAEAVAERVLTDVRPGSVVILHCDRGRAPVTEQAVRRIVPELRKRGYRLVRVSELIASAMGRS
ncbi:MAG TPA: polysaccharide deacetylase family protein [Streptomyces sp.]|nr:polysaccharide deacetylase family protein [Streptomyces sp.]